MPKCEHGCGKSAYFNTMGEKRGRFCSGHKLDGMINVIDKLCEDPHCSGQRAVFGLINEKPRFCALHKLENMINLSLKRCKGNGSELCYIVPIYNHETETKGLYCINHKKDGMVNVTGKRCEHSNCNIVAQFNKEGETKGRFCSKHKLDGMMDVKHSRCELIDCSLSPSYRFEEDTHCRFCSLHKLEGMMDGKHKKCKEPGCKKTPSFNYPDDSIPFYCNEHKLEDMMDVKHDKCEHSGCNIRPLYNNRNETRGRFCLMHKTQDMVDIVSRTCLSEWCDRQTAHNKHEGYCLVCYIHLFPDKPTAKNYKTKETHIVQYIQNQFPDVTWISDKKISDGCSRRRPDLLLDLGFQVIVIEIDENQHNKYDCSCENKRLMELSQDVGHRPLVFIRFNPDAYINQQNKYVKSCWRPNQNGIFIVNKDSNKDWEKRLDALKMQIDYWMHQATDKTVEIIHLFYDGFE